MCCLAGWLAGENWTPSCIKAKFEIFVGVGLGINQSIGRQSISQPTNQSIHQSIDQSSAIFTLLVGRKIGRLNKFVTYRFRYLLTCVLLDLPL